MELGFAGEDPEWINPEVAALVLERASDGSDWIPWEEVDVAFPGKGSSMAWRARITAERWRLTHVHSDRGGQQG